MTNDHDDYDYHEDSDGHGDHNKRYLLIKVI